MQRPARGSPNAPHLLLYDGECGLCNRLVQAVLERDRQGVFHFASLQSAVAARQLDRFGASPGRLDTFVVIENYRAAQSTYLTRARAALFVLRVLGWPWRAAAVLRVLPVALLDRAYDLVARNRYRIFGKGDSCFFPGPEHQQRFIDRLDDADHGLHPDLT